MMFKKRVVTTYCRERLTERDDKMAKCHMCLLGLIILCSFFKGTSGVDESHVFSSSGENVHLPCNNALSGCSSTTWIYTRHSAEAVELIAGGIKKNNIERCERLSLGSDCSLNIKKVTQEDYGLYSCQQYVNGKQQGTDSPVYLHVLVSSSSSQTEIRPGSSVTLSCQLYYDRVSCDSLVRTEGLQLVWVNQAGVSVMTDSRYQILFSPTRCISNLTLRSENYNRDLRCLIRKNELKTSTTKSNKNSAQADTTTVIPVHTNTGGNTNTSGFLVQDKRGTDSSVVKDVNEHKGTYETINMSIPSTPNTNEQTDDVTYSEVTSSSKNQVQKDNDHSNDRVTYATIKGAECAAQDGLYASVKK
ncbi:uncharacterized protein [Chanodichthys erythropterus]|uniref:uncharacterized protein isoform X2 n=1 Tax=Chanodichthys erythropterus TaxID=933992 RepID=UPI00351F3ECA